MSRLLTRLAAIVATGLVFVGPLSPTPADAAISSIPRSDPLLDPLQDLEEFEVQVISQINIVRTAAGLRTIEQLDSCVDGMAEGWAQHIARTGVLEHREQRQVLRRCRQTWAGEALIRGELLTPAMTVQAWLDSPPHREILMKKRARLAGVAITLDSRGQFVGVLNVTDPD